MSINVSLKVCTTRVSGLYQIGGLINWEQMQDNDLTHLPSLQVECHRYSLHT